MVKKSYAFSWLVTIAIAGGIVGFICFIDPFTKFCFNYQQNWFKNRLVSLEDIWSMQWTCPQPVQPFVGPPSFWSGTSWLRASSFPVSRNAPPFFHDSTLHWITFLIDHNVGSLFIHPMHNLLKMTRRCQKFDNVQIANGSKSSSALLNLSFFLFNLF